MVIVKNAISKFTSCDWTPQRTVNEVGVVHPPRGCSTLYWRLLIWVLGSDPRQQKPERVGLRSLCPPRPSRLPQPPPVPVLPWGVTQGLRRPARRLCVLCNGTARPGRRHQTPHLMQPFLTENAHFLPNKSLV